MKVLIVEDEEILLRVLEEEFKDEGFDVETARNGEQAIKALKSGSKFDVALLDLILPIRDGFEVLDEMKNDHSNKYITPIIVLSNLGNDEDIKKAFSLGAVDYFVKSQHPIAEVVEKVREFLNKGSIQPRKKKTMHAK
ncbi:MAG: response regulator [Candidatus Pacebacteria bacterium]|nr:response regulator [Candidatus Paceibacterota bacterium]